MSDDNIPIKRRRGFQPGQSGNPGGRPKIEPKIKELAQAACPKAIRKLIALLDSSDEKTVIAAANALLDRGIGKPTQQVQASGDISISLNLGVKV